MRPSQPCAHRCREPRGRRRENLFGILDTRRTFDPGRHVDRRRAGDAQRLGHVGGVEPAREHERNAWIDAGEEVPVEALAEPAGTRRLARRPGVEYQPVGGMGVEPDRREVGAGLDRNCLHHRQPEQAAHGGDALRRLASVQLQHIGLERLDAGRQPVVVGIDRQRHLLGPAVHALAQQPRRLEADVPRRRRKEHEADKVGAGIERDVDRVGRHQAANLDLDGHFRAFGCQRGGSSAAQRFCLLRHSRPAGAAATPPAAGCEAAARGRPTAARRMAQPHRGA